MNILIADCRQSPGFSPWTLSTVILISRHFYIKRLRCMICYSCYMIIFIKFKRSQISPTPSSVCPQTHTPIVIYNIL